MKKHPELVCPTCGSDKFEEHKVNDIDITIDRKFVYKCYNCDYIGYSSVTKNEFKNIKRTRLIDRMTKMIKMTLHI